MLTAVAVLAAYLLTLAGLELAMRPRPTPRERMNAARHARLLASHVDFPPKR